MPVKKRVAPEGAQQGRPKKRAKKTESGAAEDLVPQPQTPQQLASPQVAQGQAEIPQQLARPQVAQGQAEASEMPPAERASNKGSGSSGFFRGSPNKTRDDLYGLNCDVNEKLIVEVVAAKQAIIDQFQDITNSPAESEYKAVFCKEESKKRLGNVGKYEAVCNLFMLNPLQWCTKCTPVQERSIRWMKDFFFAPPSGEFPCTIVAGLRTGDEPDKKFGQIEFMSPPEAVWACLLACAEDLKTSPDSDRLELWRTTFLSVSIKFEIIDNENSRLWRSH